jgi:hypothetical protein
VVGDFCLDRYWRLDPAIHDRSVETGLPVQQVAAVRAMNRALVHRGPDASGEYSMLRTYLDWMCGLPWSVRTRDSLDLARAAVQGKGDLHCVSPGPAWGAAKARSRED